MKLFPSRILRDQRIRYSFCPMHVFLFKSPEAATLFSLAARAKWRTPAESALYRKAVNGQRCSAFAHSGDGKNYRSNFARLLHIFPTAFTLVTLGARKLLTLSRGPIGTKAATVHSSPPHTARVAASRRNPAPLHLHGGSRVHRHLSRSRFALLSPLFLFALHAQTLSVSSNSLTVNIPAGANGTQTQSFTITAANTAGLTLTLTPSTMNGGAWLSVSPTTITAPAGTLPFTITVDPSNLSAGSYTGQIALSMTPLPVQMVSVTVNVASTASGALAAAPAALTFTAVQGGANPQPQIVSVSAGTGGSVTQFTAEANTTNGGLWLSTSLGTNSGTVPGNFTVTASNAGLAAGTYNGTIKLTPSGGGSPTVINVALVVTPQSGGTPGLIIAPMAVQFFAAPGTTTATQTLTIAATSAGGSFSVSAASSGNWLTVNPTSGTTPASILISANPANLVPGSYNGSVIVTQNGVNTPVPVTLTVSTQNQLQLSQSGLFFGFQDGTPPLSQTVKVTTSASTSAPFSTTVSTATSSGWLQVSSSTSTTPATLNVSISPANLSPGLYTGTVVVSSPSLPNSPQSFSVTLNVTAAPPAGNTSLLVFPAAMRFFTAPGTTSAIQTLTVTSPTSGSGAASATPFTVSSSVSSGGNWLSLSAASGVTPASLSVTANPANLQAGTYNGTITITQGNLSTTVPVSLTVNSQNQIQLSQSGLLFTFQGGVAPPAQNVTLTNSAGTGLLFNASASTSDGGSWLAVNSSSGTTPATLSVTVSPSGLVAGTYSGTVTVSGNGAVNSPQSFPITLIVSGAGPTSRLGVTPTAVSLFAAPGKISPAPALLMVTSGVSGANFNVNSTSSGGTNWLSASASSTATPGFITLTANTSGLSAGTYQGTVAITPSNSATPLSVPVSLVVTSDPLLQASPQLVSFDVQSGASQRQAKPLLITRSTGGPSPFQAAASTMNGGKWLILSTAQGNTPGGLLASFDPSVVASLSPGTYYGAVSVTASGLTNSPLNIPVLLHVNSATSLSLDDSPLTFTTQSGAPLPLAQTISVSSTGAAIPVTATANVQGTANWLMVNTSLASTPSVVSVSVNPSGLAPGFYQGSVSISSTPDSAPRSVPVYLTVTSTPALSFSPASISIRGSADSRTIAFQSTSATPVNFTLATTVITPPAATWLSVSVNSGTTPAAVQVTGNTSALQPGSYLGLITVTSGSSADPQYIPVVVTVGAGGGTSGLIAAPSSLNFTFSPIQDTVPDRQLEIVSPTRSDFTVAVTTSSGGNWLSVSSPGGSTPALLMVSIDTSALQPGTYTGSITITPAGTSTSLVVPVTATVSNTSSAPSFSATPASLKFTAALGTNPAPQSVAIATGSGAPGFKVSATVSQGGSWLQVTPASGSAPATLQVAVNTSGLGAGTYSATITVSGSSGTGGSTAIPVTLSVTAPTP